MHCIADLRERLLIFQFNKWISTNFSSPDSANCCIDIFPLDFQIEKMDGETIYSGIIQVIKFINNHICLQDVSWIRCFGRLTWPRISELIISNFLSKVLPFISSHPCPPFLRVYLNSIINIR